MSGSNWWASKLGQAPAPIEHTAPPTNVPGRNVWQTPRRPAQPRPQEMPKPTTVFEKAMQAAAQGSGVANRTQKEPCPGCGGNVYMRPPEGGSQIKRCMECGYTEGRGAQGLPR